MDRRNFIKNGAIVAGLGCLSCSLLNGCTNNTNIQPPNVHDYSGHHGPCIHPFEEIHIGYNGEVSSCNPTYIKKKYGSVLEKPLMEIWNGKDYKEIREKLVKGDFSYCRRTKCHYEQSDYNENFNAEKQYPKHIALSYDSECNYKCITCRDEIVVNDKQTMEKFEKIIAPRIMPFLLNAEDVMISGGDPLSARHSRKLIKTLIQKKPDIKLSLHTQGYYLDKHNFDELGIKSLFAAAISIHSTTRKTYEKIMRQDAFDRIMRNLEFISEWKKQGKIEILAINFVVHSMNYKEMPAFVKLAEKYDAVAEFWTYNPWRSAEMHKRYNEVAVFEPWHKDNPKFRKMLQQDIFKSPHCMLDPKLLS